MKFDTLSHPIKSVSETKFNAGPKKAIDTPPPEIIEKNIDNYRKDSYGKQR